MKALTIIQPFAELIARGDKRVENRRWSWSYRGTFAIHAGKARTYGGESVYSIADDYNIPACDLALGVVIAVADMLDCIELGCGPAGLLVPEWAREKYPWLRDHEHTEGPFCFVLDKVRRLREPLPWRGAQGPFNIPDELIAVAR